VKESLRSESPSAAGPGLRATGLAVAVVMSLSENALRALSVSASRRRRTGFHWSGLHSLRHFGSSTKNVGSSSIV
jgi:hypothetical protein